LIGVTEDTDKNTLYQILDDTEKAEVEDDKAEVEDDKANHSETELELEKLISK
jgi:hypothetical protein